MKNIIKVIVLKGMFDMGINVNDLYDTTKEKINGDITELKSMLDYEDVLLTISKEIVSYRKENNLTQKEMAKKVGVNQVMISKLENGTFNPTFLYIFNISQKLTKSSKMFLNILKKIILKLKIDNEGDYNFAITEVKYNHLEDSNIIYCDFDAASDTTTEYNGGVKNYGEDCTSSISNVG